MLYICVYVGAIENQRVQILNENKYYHALSTHKSRFKTSPFSSPISVPCEFSIHFLQSHVRVRFELNDPSQAFSPYLHLIFCVSYL